MHRWWLRGMTRQCPGPDNFDCYFRIGVFRFILHCKAPILTDRLVYQVCAFTKERVGNTHCIYYGIVSVLQAPTLSIIAGMQPVILHVIPCMAILYKPCVRLVIHALTPGRRRGNILTHPAGRGSNQLSCQFSDHPCLTAVERPEHIGRILF